MEVAGYGQWYAREKNDVLKGRVPSNATISRRLTHLELRDLYARSAFVVLPVRDLVYSAGSTGALEAGCMARAVIAFRSQGIVDYIVDGETGILIEPGDIAGLNAAIQHLLASPVEARRMGENARQRILEQFRLESYVEKISNVLLQI
jgi:glycosyltransferase involved in cell wall biosynthesis